MSPWEDLLKPTHSHTRSWTPPLRHFVWHHGINSHSEHVNPCLWFSSCRMKALVPPLPRFVASGGLSGPCHGWRVSTGQLKDTHACCARWVTAAVRPAYKSLRRYARLSCALNLHSDRLQDTKRKSSLVYLPYDPFLMTSFESFNQHHMQSSPHCSSPEH